MTPAPISVERFDPCLTPESDDMGLQSITADMELATFGEYVRHSDYAALLHQLAELERKASNRHAQVIESDERDAEVDRLKAQAEEDRELRMDVERQWNQMMGQLEAAERAREEFRLLASLRLFHAPTIGYCWFERCGVSWTGKAHATINEANAEKTAAFLAASGGDHGN